MMDRGGARSEMSVAEMLADISDPQSERSRAAPQKPADRAYHGIRRAILTGELEAGDHLAEEPLAQMTGTSRTPVREALRRLVGEGLAIEEKRRRFVADFSYEEVCVVFDVRAKLEGYAAGLAARKIRAAELGELQKLIDAIDDIEARGVTTDETARERFVELNSRFHATIVKAARSRQLLLLTAQAVAAPLAVIKQFVCDQGVNPGQSNAQHRDILAALKNGSPEWAAAAMESHVLSTKPQRPRRAAGIEP